MEFRTKMVIMVTKKKATLAYVGLGIAVISLFLLLIPSMRVFVTPAFVIGVVTVLIGAYIAKGDIAAFGLSDGDLVLTEQAIRLGEEYYSLREVKQLDFDINGYAGMKDPASAYELDGMSNRVSFKCKGQTIERMFYLNSKEHVRQLGEVFKLLYEKHIPFVERTGRTRTYLFRDLDAAGLADFKKKYGYM
ncbi:hypothetical protein Q4E93_21610 [Flavitalea sp. BT771]|uniref:hypothetical protein n=1 Tax=Flavitalea sp. BT771 TaxID=3063329 RepID=UPI0026E1B8A9|nr:hypothetical protein [Flavitalea sp. BT771]MDO6433222.1 hypothetical protein [Flavitalea sp. BT771]MDV6221502.1 hypothetical protein [Flavitalea sp. BT771]